MGDTKQRDTWRLGRLCCLALCWLVGCGRGPSAPLVLNDFETPADLRRIFWRCRTTFDLTDTFHSHGRSGLIMTMHPDPYPGLRLLLAPKERDWRGYRFLALEVSNPQAEPITLHYRLDDQPAPGYGERINGSWQLPPGTSQLRLALDDLRTSDGLRPLRRQRIEQVLFFTIAPRQPLRLEVDHLRLEP